jgi:TonB family protein
MADAASSSPAQPTFAWSDGARSFQIHLRPSVMGRLGTESWVAFKRVPRRGLEIGGVLLGRTERKEDTTTFWIEEFAAVESEHRSGPSYVLSESDLGHMQDEIRRNGTASIGIFRSQTRSEQLVLQEPDTGLLERYFDPGDSLFLMVGPVPGKAALFIRTNGSVGGVHEFPLTSLSSVLKGSQNLRAQDADPPIPAPEIRSAVTRVVRQLDAPKIGTQGANEPPQDRPAAMPPLVTHEHLPEAPETENAEPLKSVLTVKPVAHPGVNRGRWMMAAALVVLLVTAAFGVRSYSAPRARASVRSALEYIQLGVERDGSSLRVRWDRNSPTLRDATRAVLHVQDGDIQVDRILTASDLSTGSAAYEPKNSDLAFRLDVYSVNPHATGQLQVMNLASPPEIPQARLPEAHIQPEPRATAPARHPTFTPVVNAKPAETPSITKIDEVSVIRPTVPKPVDGMKPEVPEAAPRRFDNAQTKSPDAPESPAPRVPENSSPPRAAIATGRAVATSVSSPNIPVPDVPAPNTPTPNKGPSVSVLAEPVSSRLGHVVGKVPLLRRLNGHDHVAPAVPVYQAQPALKLPNQQHVTEPVLVDVKVDVAESGKVRSAEIVGYGEPPNFSLANAALAAARQWTFKPARTEDLPVSSQVVLHFHFTP